MKEKNNLDNTSSVLGRLSLGPTEARDITQTINELSKVDPHEKDMLYDPYEFFDDVTGQTLDKKMAVEARKLEMQFFRNMKVYDKVPRWMAARDGCKVITTKWRDINKGRPAEPELQSKAGRQGDQDGFSTGLVCRYPSIGVLANGLLHVCKQSGQKKSIQDNVDRRPKGVFLREGHAASLHRDSHRGLRAGVMRARSHDST